MLFSTFTHVVACVGSSFLFMAEGYSIVWTSHFIHSSVDGHFGCFHLGVFVKNAVINIRVDLCFYFSWIYSFEWNSGSYGHPTCRPFEELPDFSKVRAPLPFPSAACVDSGFSALALVACLFDSSH